MAETYDAVVDHAISRVTRHRGTKIHTLDPLHPDITRCGLKVEQTRPTAPSDHLKLCAKCHRLPTRLRVRTTAR